MSGMKLIGVADRARLARAALNRLRWEVDHAIEQGRVGDVADSELAEVVGIVSNVLEALAAALPEQPANEVDQVLGTARARFVQRVEFYTEYHKVPR